MIPYLSKMVIRRFADSRAIYERGRNYFKHGNVHSFELLGEGDLIEARVDGNYGLYCVSLWMDEEGELEAECDCPYDGYICKHIIAVLLMYNNEIKRAAPPEEEPPPKPELKIAVKGNTVSKGTNGKEGPGTDKDKDREGTNKARDREGMNKAKDREGTDKDKDREGVNKNKDREGTNKDKDREGVNKNKDREGMDIKVQWDFDLEKILERTNRKAVLGAFRLLRARKVKIDSLTETRYVVTINVPRLVSTWYSRGRGTGKPRVVIERSFYRDEPRIECNCTIYGSDRCEHVAAALIVYHMKRRDKKLNETEGEFLSWLRRERFGSLVLTLNSMYSKASGRESLYDFYFASSVADENEKNRGSGDLKLDLHIMKKRRLRSGKRGMATEAKVNHIKKYYTDMSECRRSAFEEFIKNVMFSQYHGWYSQTQISLTKKDFDGDTDSGLLSELRTLHAREPDSFEGCVFPKAKGTVELKVSIDGVGEKARIRSVIELGEDRFNLDEPNVNLIGKYPLWCSVYNGDRKEFAIFELDTVSPDFIRNLSGLTDAEAELTEMAGFFVDHYPRLTELVKVVLPEDLRVEERSYEPAPRLFLRDHLDSFSIELRFLYGQEEIPYDEGSDIVYRKDGNGLIGIKRDMKKEEDYRSTVLDSRTEERKGHIVPSTDPFEWLADTAGELALQGFEIYGRDDLTNARISTEKPRLKLEISSGIDWFDMKGSVSFGKQKVSLGDLIGSVNRHERFVKLGDGSHGVLPGKWLEKLSGTVGLLERDAEGKARASRSQIALLEALLGISDTSKVDRKFGEIRKRFSRFRSIESVPLPAGLKGELRPYQKAGYDWLQFLKDFSFGGCLADEMGLGKTVQVLSLLLSEKERGVNRPSLVVVPRSLLFNWEAEIAKFTPAIKAYVHHGSKRPRTGGRIWGYGRDLVITTYGTLRRDKDLFGKKIFHYIILDESQNIKNPLSKTARAIFGMAAEHKLVMTGTPIENNSMDLWSQFAFLNPGLLGKIEYFKETFAKSIERDRDQERAKALRSMIYPFLLMRKKEMVAPDLPKKQVSVTYCEMDRKQRRVYDGVRDEIRADLERTMQAEGFLRARFKVLAGLMKLRQLCDHPRLVDESYTGGSGKFRVLMEMIPEVISKGHKVLVFSSFVKMLEVFRQEFEKRKIEFSYLTGKTRKRKEQVERFQNDPGVSAFLISLKAGGLGLNLTEADYVFIVDPWWNPAAEMQAIDRTHRIGQTKSVFVYKAIAKDSVEEKILKLQESKVELVKNVIAVDEGIFKKLDRDDIEKLFT